MMFVNERPGSIQKDLSVELNLAPSTVTRFVDTLVRKGLLRRTLEGRNALIYPTEEGARLQADLLGAWERLFQRYTQILGEEGSQSLTQAADQAARALGE
jgi:DNA-binding MarR family transcriptional regulator